MPKIVEFRQGIQMLQAKTLVGSTLGQIVYFISQEYSIQQHNMIYHYTKIKQYGNTHHKTKVKDEIIHRNTFRIKDIHHDSEIV